MFDITARYVNWNVIELIWQKKQTCIGQPKEKAIMQHSLADFNKEYVMFENTAKH